ncbi:hypothetical protein L6452_39048 [Arctium lappa]|uniref:Uncharacterized protein n=1 Tax=Arctium lappa TaxID=4217 RepID=A0ACB8XRG7_ARCLA|nr:hypothetical protein L6452_39048 [Arctium lappa]
MEPNQCRSWWSGYNNIQSMWKLVEEKPSPSSARIHLGSRLATNVMMVVTTISDRRWLDAVVPVVGDDGDGLETSGERSGH